MGAVSAFVEVERGAVSGGLLAHGGYLGAIPTVTVVDEWHRVHLLIKARGLPETRESTHD